MAQIEMSRTPEIRVSRAKEGEIILLIRADGGSVQIRAGRTAEDAGLLFRSLQDASHAAFMIEEDWPDEQDVAAHDDHAAAEAAALGAYERYRADVAAALESYEGYRADLAARLNRTTRTRRNPGHAG
jgi:hypothetical protein